MKNLIVVVGFIFALSLFSCGKKNENANVTVEQNDSKNTVTAEDNEFRIIEQEKVDNLNKVLAEKQITSIDAIMQEYHEEDKGAEGNYTYIITEAKTDNPNVIMLSLLEDGRNDDSIKAVKVNMEVESKDGKYKVLSIKESYQCWENRGHEDWAADFCS